MMQKGIVGNGRIRGFTLVEVIIAIFILSIGLISILQAFKETFTVLSYINDSINGSYLAKNGVEEVIAVRNSCLSQYGQNGWQEFISRYGSGTFVIKPGIGGCSQSLSGVIDRPASYEWPLDAFGETTQSQNGVYYQRKLDMSTESGAFYLQRVDRSGTGISLVFSQPIYHSPNLLLSVPLSESGGNLVKMDADYGSQYDINGNSASNNSSFSNLSNADTRYSKVFDYGSVSITDGKGVRIQDPSGGMHSFEFDDNGTVTDSGATIISFSGLTTDVSQYRLCKKINELTFVDCRFNKMLSENFYEKFFGTAENPPMDFGSGFTFSVSSNRMDIVFGTGADIRTEHTNQFINPFYEIRSLSGSNAFALASDSSDTTSGRGVEIPDRPAGGGINTATWYTSLVNGKIHVYMYDAGKFIEETGFSFKLWDIKRGTY